MLTFNHDVEMLHDLNMSRIKECVLRHEKIYLYTVCVNAREHICLKYQIFEWSFVIQAGERCFDAVRYYLKTFFGAFSFIF